MAVEYITSRNMISLIYETMRVMNVSEIGRASCRERV